jgi:hypothetical protein
MPSPRLLFCWSVGLLYAGLARAVRLSAVKCCPASITVFYDDASHTIPLFDNLDYTCIDTDTGYVFCAYGNLDSLGLGGAVYGSDGKFISASGWEASAFTKSISCATCKTVKIKRDEFPELATSDQIKRNVSEWIALAESQPDLVKRQPAYSCVNRLSISFRGRCHLMPTLLQRQQNSAKRQTSSSS